MTQWNRVNKILPSSTTGEGSLLHAPPATAAAGVHSIICFNDKSSLDSSWWCYSMMMMAPMRVVPCIRRLSSGIRWKMDGWLDSEWRRTCWFTIQSCINVWQWHMNKHHKQQQQKQREVDGFPWSATENDRFINRTWMRRTVCVGESMVDTRLMF